MEFPYGGQYLWKLEEIEFDHVHAHTIAEYDEQRDEGFHPCVKVLQILAIDVVHEQYGQQHEPPTKTAEPGPVHIPIPVVCEVSTYSSPTDVGSYRSPF